MAQSWRARPGTAVRYRDGAGRVFHAIVTAVTNQTTLDLRVGRTAVAGSVRDTNRTGAGWFRSQKELT